MIQIYIYKVYSYRAIASIISTTDVPNRALVSKNKHPYSYERCNIFNLNRIKRNFTSANFAPSLYFTGRFSSSSHRSVLFPTSTTTQSSSADSLKIKIKLFDDELFTKIYSNTCHPCSNISKCYFRCNIINKNNTIGFTEILFSYTSKSILVN